MASSWIHYSRATPEILRRRPGTHLIQTRERMRTTPRVILILKQAVSAASWFETLAKKPAVTGREIPFEQQRHELLLSSWHFSHWKVVDIHSHFHSGVKKYRSKNNKKTKTEITNQLQTFHEKSWQISRGLSKKWAFFSQISFVTRSLAWNFTKMEQWDEQEFQLGTISYTIEKKCRKSDLLVKILEFLVGACKQPCILTWIFKLPSNHLK